MVHALQEAWRVARAMVLDIRPLPAAPQLWVRDRAGREAKCGDLARRADAPEAHAEAERAVGQVVRCASPYFTAAAARQFDWIDVFEDPDELIEEVSEEWENWIVDEDTALKLMRTVSDTGRGAAPFIRQAIKAQVLKKAP